VSISLSVTSFFPFFAPFIVALQLTMEAISAKIYFSSSLPEHRTVMKSYGKPNKSSLLEIVIFVKENLYFS